MNDLETKGNFFQNAFGSISNSQIIVFRSKRNKVIPIAEIVETKFIRKRNPIIAFLYFILTAILIWANINYIKESIWIGVMIAGPFAFICFIAFMYFIKGYYVIVLKTKRNKKIRVKVEMALYKEGKQFNNIVQKMLLM